MLKGIAFKDDPILASICRAKHMNEQVMMHSKSRFVLPDSGTLLGVTDPTGMLEAD